MNETPHSKFPHLYAVVRMDFPVDTEYPENSIAVVKAFSSKLDADKEVDRLNKLRAGKKSRYVMITTRFVPSAN